MVIVGRVQRAIDDLTVRTNAPLVDVVRGTDPLAPELLGLSVKEARKLAALLSQAADEVEAQYRSSRELSRAMADANNPAKVRRR